MRLLPLAALTLWILAAPGRAADAEVVWEETPTHRVKVKYLDGKEVGRWRFAKKLSVAPSPEEETPATPPSPPAPKVAPILDREILQLRIAELRARALGERPREARALREQVLALAASSMQAALERHGLSPEGVAFVRLAAEVFHPGDPSHALPGHLVPLAHGVTQALAETMALYPRDASRPLRMRWFEDLLLASGIRRATREPGLALEAAEEAGALFVGYDFPGVEYVRARAQKAQALAMLAREERTSTRAFVEKIRVRIPAPESCGEAGARLERARELLEACLEEIERAVGAKEVPAQAMPRAEEVRGQLEAVQDLRRRAAECDPGWLPPLGDSRRASHGS